MKVFIASDHGGFELKNLIVENLKNNFEVIDLGPNKYDEDDDYPDYAKALSMEIINSDPTAFGILICRSGNGMCIAANKFKGIYAALCFTPEHARKAREHNNANVLCLDSDYTKEDLHLKIVDVFLNTKFDLNSERHVRRVEKIKEIEEV